ncbi:cytochrome P450 4A2-like isoform X2 [Dreissena polymorpha]|uniref:cytochrome P450 4A2-like isoform X2 n=1 Tax=Dreissena polymorpha TaxID=45954 RepID=UPI002263E4BA|nr:cytochrome P450 4A2-like isoform X2 [Dreissena polymorpha]
MYGGKAVDYVLTIVVGWLAWKLVRFIWKREEHKRIFADIPLLCHHWFWGITEEVKSVNDLTMLAQRFVEKTGAKWFSTWLLFLEPAVFPCHPDIFRAVYSAIDVRKRHGWAGPYRMFAAWAGEGLLTSNGKKWERNRRLLTPAFHFDILKSYVNVYNTTTSIFMDKIGQATSDGKSVDVYPYISRATLDTMLRCGMSYVDPSVQNDGNQHPYVSAVHRLGALLFERLLKPVLYWDFIYYNMTAEGKEFRKYCDKVHQFADEIILDRRRSIKAQTSDECTKRKRHLDFLDILITARDDAGLALTDKEIREEVDTFLFAGHDTTASAISWCLYSLGLHPGVQDAVRDEIEAILPGDEQPTSEIITQLQYTTCVIKEVLRFFSPVPAQSRILARPLTMEGKTFPAGQIIDIQQNALHHNPAVWGDDHNEFKPERFLPENSVNRDPFAFLPFAAGQRNCIGQHFAMNEIKTFVASVVKRFTLKIDRDRTAVPIAEITTRAKDGIYLHFLERKSSV